MASGEWRGEPRRNVNKVLGAQAAAAVGRATETSVQIKLE